MTERGALLGSRYKLDQVIGRGGMAEVWRARDLRLERDVAVKRLRVDLASDPTFQARFRREAQSAAGLNHPHIVSVYDTGEERDRSAGVDVPYIVMELVEGVTLREVLRDGRKIVPDRALEFTAGVLDALAYSHRSGIIHRDIKPANVMLTPNGTVKVMDFGIARAVADTSATMTQTAAVIGTAQYLSPEQARGEKVDNRSDIYAVGCLLYELLTSQPLFKGDSPVSVAYQHVRETPVTPSQIDEEITPDMDAIVLKALAKDPRDRYQDASEMREDILRTLDGRPILATMPSDDDATQLLPQDTMTNTAARRGAVVAPPLVASAPSPAAPPADLMLDDEEEEPKSRKGLIALAVAAGVVLIALGIAIWMVLNPPGPEEPTVQTVAIPNVVGQNELAAVSQIQGADLEPSIEREVGSEADRGQVLRTEPGPEEVVEVGSTVVLVVSSGPDIRTIPEGILNVPFETARGLLEAAGFTNVQDPVDADPADEPIDADAGDVISSNPSPGSEAAPDDPITLTVATGQSIVPTLVDLTLEEAQEAAANAGFELEVVEEENDEVEAGRVFDQTPQRGAAADRGEMIEVKVAIAPALPVVPSLTGMTVEEAQQAVAPLGFELDPVEQPSTDQPAGRIFDQDPDQGTAAEPGTTIQVLVAQPVVPLLTGLTVEEARQRVEALGLTLDVVEQETADEPAGQIFDQDPDEGTAADAGSSVQVLVAVAPPASQPTVTPSS